MLRITLTTFSEIQRHPFVKVSSAQPRVEQLCETASFFFGNWESLRSRRSNTLSALLVTPAQLSGDLTGLSSTKRDPATGASAHSGSSNGCAIPGQQNPDIPDIDRDQDFITYTPQPNANVAGKNYVTTKSTNRDDDQYGFRLDYQINTSDTLPERAKQLYAMLKDWRVSVHAEMPKPNPKYDRSREDYGYWWKLGTEPK